MRETGENVPEKNEKSDVEKSIQSSWDRLDRAEAISKTGNWELHLDNGIMVGSEGARVIYNLKGSQWNLAEVREVSLPEYRPVLEKTLRGLIENNDPYNVEFKIKQVGTGKILDIHSIAEYDKDKKILFGVIKDITDRKRTEESLYEAKELFFSVFNLCPLPILLSSLATGKYLDANKTFYELLEFSPEDVIGRTSTEIGVFVNYADRETLVSTVRSHGFIIGLECPLYTKTKKIKSCLVSIATVMRGGEKCLLTCFIDITDRKRMEEELQRAQKLDSLGVLAGGIAHDFNNLLAGIFGYVDLARIMSKDARITEYLESTIATMNRARALTFQLLTFAKGGSPVQKTTPIVTFIQETARFALSGSNISPQFKLAEDLRSCNIDKNQIGQVLDNIIINAQQSMPGGGTIEISANNVSFMENEHPPLMDRAYVKVSIKDHGVGIPKEIMPRIFDPFYTTKTKGHGLGLATCYSIVNRHGGCIDVESQPGKGSTFHVYLPASLEGAAESLSVIVKHTGSGTIIIMDDEEVVRETVGKMLESMGYDVVCKNDGKEAIDFYFAQTKAGRGFAAMIFDLTIPGGVGGLEAIGVIRKSDSKIPVFVASGYAENSVMKNPARYGFTASISKPFITTELSEMLGRFLKPPEEKT